MLVLEAQNISDFLVRQRSLVFFHLSGDFDIGVVPLQNLARRLDSGDERVGGVEYL